MITRDTAIKARKAVLAMIQGEFPRKGLRVLSIGNSDGHVNLMTHNDILWKESEYDHPFMGIDVRLYPKGTCGGWDDTEKVLPDAKVLVRRINKTLAKFFSISHPHVRLEQRQRGWDRVEKHSQYNCENYRVRYFIKDDAGGWGRPSIIVWIWFQR